MKKEKKIWYNRTFPQNFIIKKPLIGSWILMILCFGFLMLYRPLSPNDNKIVPYEWAMLLYCLVCGIYCFISISLLKHIRYFSDKVPWTLFKEVIFSLILLFGMGVVVYISGFVIEMGEPRFMISCRDAFLIIGLPYSFFTVFNIPYLFSRKSNHKEGEPSGEAIRIKSKLKNETLRLYPDQFIYAESDGNYVVFYLSRDNQLKKEVIRNSISDIELQLSEYPQFMRIHRAFIVNLKKIRSKEGNVLGYQLKLIGTDTQIPVSRQNTKNFNKRYRQLLS